MKKLIKIVFASATLVLSGAVFADTQPVAATFTPAQVTQMQKIIHDYLVSNPQVLVEASKVLQAQQEQQMESAAMAGIAQNKAALFNDAQSPSIGNKTAPITIVEFFDYQCGHCREMAPQVEKLMQGNKNIRYIFKEFPIFGANSELAAKIALAAAMQSHEKYYALHNAFLASTVPLTKDSMMAMAKKVGLNIAKLNADMNLPVTTKQLRDNFQLAQALKLPGTPAFIITNKAQTKFQYIPGATSLANLEAQVQKVQQ